jgi:hypothetical protein
MRAAHVPTRACPRCKQTVAITPSKHLRAHTCPHGGQCIVPYARRRLGEKADHCAQCLGTPDTRLEPGQMRQPKLPGVA